MQGPKTSIVTLISKQCTKGCFLKLYWINWQLFSYLLISIFILDHGTGKIDHLSQISAFTQVRYNYAHFPAHLDQWGRISKGHKWVHFPLEL